MRILVTGADGFVGRYLTEELQNYGHWVIRGLQMLDRTAGDGPNDIRFDLCNDQSLFGLIETARPDAVIHLAAQSSVQAGWDRPGPTMEVNLLGTIRLMEAIRHISTQTRIMTVGSGEEYGMTAKSGKPLHETDPCYPMNPYAVSKYSAGLASGQIATAHGMKHIHVRPFNHFGPGQREGFVVSDFASRIARIEAGKHPPVLRVGNLSAERDFTHVADIVRAYRLLLEKDAAPGVYNICSGAACPIRKIMDILVGQARMTLEVRLDERLNRPSEIPSFVGSPQKIVQMTEWRQERDLRAGLEETLNWWRDRMVDSIEFGIS